jgi:ABC-type Fe3+/spermidine/putrescine transport system ATPase subunit
VADFIGQTNLLDGQLLEVDGSLASIDLPGAGHIRAEVPHGVPASDQVQVTVRPEKITLNLELGPAEAPDGWNCVPGMIEEAVYLGTHTQYVVRLASGSTIIVHRQNTASRPDGPMPGAAVKIAFDPQSASVLGE